MKIYPFLQLLRPANIVTAVADILAGAAIAGFFLVLSDSDYYSLLYLILSTIGLYGGGIVLNDYFDAELDLVERPERPIPSGKVKKSEALTLGVLFLIFGVFSAFLNSENSGLIAFCIAILTITYDKYTKHIQWLGPLNMGLCRAGNLLLGISIITASLAEFWPICFLPLIFIAAITLTSQGENIGNNRIAIGLALSLDLVVFLTLIYLGLTDYLRIWNVIPFLVLWVVINLIAKIRAIKENEPKMIMKAVKMGVLSLIPLNASYAAGFGGWEIGIIVLSLLPISILLTKKFAVT